MPVVAVDGQPVGGDHEVVLDSLLDSLLVSLLVSLVVSLVGVRVGCRGVKGDSVHA